LFVLFLSVTAHVESERALAASFVVFGMILGVSLLGGLLYIFYKPRDEPHSVDEERSAAGPPTA
jgi:hypothetical protein